jgi:hypothetical protein
MIDFFCKMENLKPNMNYKNAVTAIKDAVLRSRCRAFLW